MKCPNCGYMHGDIWDENDNYKKVEGENGAFWDVSNSIAMLSPDRYSNAKHEIYGCPDCGILFMY